MDASSVVVEGGNESVNQSVANIQVSEQSEDRSKYGLLMKRV